MTTNHERLTAEGFELLPDDRYVENLLREYIVHVIRLEDGSYYGVPTYSRMMADDWVDVAKTAEETFKRRRYGERLADIKKINKNGKSS